MASIGAIAGATVPLALALAEWWQLGVLVVAGVWLLALRRGVVWALIGGAVLGIGAAYAGLALPRVITGASMILCIKYRLGYCLECS